MSEPFSKSMQKRVEHMAGEKLDIRAERDQIRETANALADEVTILREASKRMTCGHLQADWIAPTCPSTCYVEGHKAGYCGICAEQEQLREALRKAERRELEALAKVDELQTVREEAISKGGIAMDIGSLKNALNSPEISDETTEMARTAALSANQETRDTISRMDKHLQLEVTAVYHSCGKHEVRWTGDVMCPTCQSEREEAAVAAAGAMREACRVAVITYNILLLEDFEKAKCTPLELTVQQMPLVTSEQAQEWLREWLREALRKAEQTAAGAQREAMMSALRFARNYIQGVHDWMHAHTHKGTLPEDTFASTATVKAAIDIAINAPLVTSEQAQAWLRK